MENDALMERDAATDLHDNGHSSSYSSSSSYSTHPEAPHYENSSGPSSDPSGKTDPSRLEHLSQDVEALRQAIALDTSRFTQKITHLRRQIRWLSGGLIAAVIALGGAIAFTTVPLWNEQENLRNEQRQLTEQIRTLEEDGINIEEFEQFQEQLSILNQRTQELSEQAQSLLQQLPEVTSRQFETLQQQLQELERTLQDNLSRDAALSQFYSLDETLRGILFNGQSNPVDASEASNSPSTNNPSNSPRSGELTQN